MSPGRDNLASLGTPERLGDLPLLPMPAGAPIFEQTLEYFSPQHAQSRYAGNIAETSWRRGNAEADTYAYTYDRLGRLVDSRIICSGTRLKFYGERDISYDKNTNILSITRYNGLLTGSQYRYTYDGNRKLSVTSGASAETATNYGYQYDIMGNISKIGAENLLISYNYLNLPKQVTKMWAPRTEGAATDVVGVIRPTASYLYLADGTKVQAIGETGQGYEYVGSYSCTFSRLGIARTSTALPSAYRKSSLRLSVNGSNVDIESIQFAGGMIVKTSNGYEPQYYITDHLGSTRTIVKPKATVVAEFDYMPYGTLHSVATAPIAEADYKYTGKEQQTAFGLDNLYDSQARFQYVTDGMFLSHDPLSGNFSDISPYMYCGGDPINRVDFNGKDWFSFQKIDYDKNGEEINQRTVYEYTQYNSQQELNNAGIKGSYLGEVVVIFNGSEDERIGDDGTLTGDNARPAIVTIYGKNGENDIQQYNGLTVSSNPNIYPMIEAGDYKAFHQQMATSVYGKGALTYRITTISGDLLIPPAGGINKHTGLPYISGEYFHRTDWNGKATKASQGCLIIDGRDWKKVEKQIGKSHNIFIRVIR